MIDQVEEIKPPSDDDEMKKMIRVLNASKIEGAYHQGMDAIKLKSNQNEAKMKLRLR